MGNYIWAGSQKVGKFEELVAMEADGELGRVGVAIVGDWVFTLAQRKSVFCEGVGAGATSR